MGYACPVCEVPQRDGEHLANHLAFTAMLRGDEHEAWLDEYAPGWGDERPADLADRVTPHAAETEYDEVFEDTAHDHGSGDRADPTPGGRGPAAARGADGFEGMAGSVADEAVESVLREAEELTEEMYGLDDADGATDGSDGEGDADGNAEAAETGTDDRTESGDDGGDGETGGG